MVSRVIKEKGVLEYFKAAKIVKEKYPDATQEYRFGEVSSEDVLEI